jgi:predicted dehydrogenase
MRVGIIGAGGMGGVHARQYAAMADVELAIYDRKPERRLALAQHGARPVESLAELIAQVDVVDICLPTDMHAETAHLAIAAGRAVFCEKPLAHNVAEAVSVMRAADRAGVALMPGHVVRFFPDYAAGAAAIARGEVGEPAAARLRRGSYAPTGSDGWFRDYQRSGGALLDLAIHDFDWLRWTLGEVTTVFSRSVGMPRGGGPDYALSTLRLDSGCVAHVESTWMDPTGFRAAYEIAGSKGLLQYDSREAPALRYAPVTAREGGGYLPGSGANETPLFPQDDPYYRELHGFLDAVRAGTSPPVTALDGVRALAISEAAIESARTGCPVCPARQF